MVLAKLINKSNRPANNPNHPILLKGVEKGKRKSPPCQLKQYKESNAKNINKKNMKGHENDLKSNPHLSSS